MSAVARRFRRRRSDVQSNGSRPFSRRRRPLTGLSALAADGHSQRRGDAALTIAMIGAFRLRFPRRESVGGRLFFIFLLFVYGSRRFRKKPRRGRTLF